MPATHLVVQPTTLPRRTLLAETLLVLGVSLGASAVRAVLSIIRKLTYEAPLSAQTTRMNTSVTPDRPWLDLAYQLAGIAIALVPVVLALHLLTRDRDRAGGAGWGGPAARAIGFDLRRPGQDLVRGLALAAAVGIPGLAFYLAARELGFNTSIAAANLEAAWWTVPVLVLASIQNAVLEEVLMVGYLFTRWAQAGWSTATIIVTSALIRGTYHLYQGFGGFVGNVVMGLVFGWLYRRWGRVMPLVVAHVILDLVSFIGYALVAPYVDWF